MGNEAKQAKRQNLFFCKKNKAENSLVCAWLTGQDNGTCDLWVVSESELPADLPRDIKNASHFFAGEGDL